MPSYTMNSLRKYFILRRLESAACPQLLCPVEVTITDTLEVTANWGDRMAPVTKILKGDELKEKEPEILESYEEEDQEEDEEEDQMEEKKNDEKMPAPKKKCPCGCDNMERYGDYRPCGNYVKPVNACVCGCQDRVSMNPKYGHPSNYRIPDMFQFPMYRARGDCIFTSRCACGCESGMTEDEWRGMRLKQCVEQKDNGWNEWDKEMDPLICSWVRTLYASRSMLTALEKNNGDSENMKRRLRKHHTRVAALERRIAARRETLKGVEDVENEEPESASTGAYTLEDIKDQLPPGEIIDGMCVAVQRCHTLRILHRNIRLSSFAIKRNSDECRVVLRDWTHACFNPGNTAFSNVVQHTFARPDWGESPPEMAGDLPKRIGYGFEYDMWCLGLCIFEVLYQVSLGNEVDPEDFTDQWLAEWIRSHPITIPNASLYTILLRVILTADPRKRACSYAAMNMTDGPRNSMFEQRMDVISEKQDPTRLAQKFPVVPDIGSMLSVWLRDGDELVTKLRVHDYTPRAIMNVGHWRGCMCGNCNVRVHLPVIQYDGNTPPLRNNQTRLMYAMAHACTGNHTLLGHQFIAVFSQLADSILSDHDTSRIDLDMFEFTSESKFRKQLAQTAMSLKDLRIRI